MCGAESRDVVPLEMSKKFKELLRKHFRKTLMEQRPDAFHRTMLLCIRSSPKLNEIIACQVYCFRDLTKWPKLNRMCQSQQAFYSRLIEDLRLDGIAVAEQAYKLGGIHYNYAQYGLKPHFLDLFTLHFENVLQRLKFPSDEEKQMFVAAFRQLNVYVTSIMNIAYSHCQQRALLTKKSR
ncbi:unnamed protein product [Heligmosomoides polygyrus]|uniref:GLOBIN domain-containing protein n=1 Tax=Heligmosomoides polygyrus TaxID=6339 RepID=A0A183G6W2_HELPZ|nr:unnamed protein product [Heligmosomoides polygyrus]